MKDEIEKTRMTLAGTDIASLPNDMPLSQIAEARMDERRKFEGRVKQLEGTLHYILAQAKARHGGDARTIQVIAMNAEIALNEEVQAIRREAHAKAVKSDAV